MDAVSRGSVINLIQYSEKPVIVADTPFLVFRGCQDCRWTKESIYHRLTLLCAFHAGRFPDRQDRRTIAGDLCALYSNCPNHGSEHGRILKAGDFNYFTWGTNLTQYKHQNEPLENIWEEPGVKLNSNFDWERNYNFFKSLVRYFPQCKIRTHEVIWNKIKKHLTREQVNDICTHIFCDRGLTYNHHIHFHVDFF